MQLSTSSTVMTIILLAGAASDGPRRGMQNWKRGLRGVEVIAREGSTDAHGGHIPDKHPVPCLQMMQRTLQEPDNLVPIRVRLFKSQMARAGQLMMFALDARRVPCLNTRRSPTCLM
jgi:hypothetical protein